MAKSEKYAEYLASPEWEEKRELVLRRARGLCEGCASKPAVHVHHLTYEHIGNEFLWELAAVCEQCHEKCHPDKGKLSFNAMRGSPVESERVEWKNMLRRGIERQDNPNKRKWYDKS